MAFLKEVLVEASFDSFKYNASDSSNYSISRQ